VNVESVGIRPKFDAACSSCTKCLPICPGYAVDAGLAAQALPKETDWCEEFGPALEIWEGHASDPEIRHRASSGGVLSALSVYCLEQEGMAFVVHSAMDPSQPYLNKTVQSRTRAEILARAGSRYAPASPCDGLAEVEKSDRPCVFIGKPCDAAAVGMMRRARPELDRNLGLVLTFFCAGTPSTTGTLDLLKGMDISKESVDTVRYRGDGWPGIFKILHDGGKQESSLSYEESWGKLSHYRPLRCHLCPDGLGRIADVSCGDAWESFGENENPGQSIVIVRTPRGREIVRRAMAANYVQLTPATRENVLAAQPNLLQKRNELFGRLVGLRLFMVPVPHFHGFSLFQGWMRLSLLRKARTFLGTVKRVMLRELWRRKPLFVR
jgi:coenzyme F420 hydrogenase subunit beta